MNAMTLLRAMSRIDPGDIEAAYRAAGSDASAPQIRLHRTEGSAEAASEPQLHPLPDPAAGRRYAVGGWAAVAACIVLILAAGMFFRSRENFPLTPSDAGTVAQTAALTTAQPVQTQMPAGTVTEPAQNGSGISAGGFTPTETQTAVQTADAAEPVPEETGTDTTAVPEDTTAVSAETTAAAEPASPSGTVQQPEVPALVATSDGSGSLFPEQIPEAEKAIPVVITDPAEIRAFLNRAEPAVTLGIGHKSDNVRDAILAAPEMLLIRWQMPDHRFSAAGIQRAELTQDGVMHIAAAMYADGEPAEEQPRVFEIGLLYEAGTIPAIQNTELKLEYYIDTDETGLLRYIEFTESLEEDVCIHVTGIGEKGH